MKLLYIANIRIPTEKAHGLQIVKMCEAFASLGVNVTLLAPKRLNHIKLNPFTFYGAKRNFKIKRVFCIDLITLGIPRIGFWLESASFALAALLYVLSNKTGFIYSRDSFSLFLPSFFRRNIIYEAHTFPGHFGLHRRVLRKSKAVVVITQKLKSLFVERGIPGYKILVVPDGVDMNLFDINQSQRECRQNLNLPLDKKIVLYAGHLYRWKGAHILAKAAQYLNKDVLIVFVGGTKKDIRIFNSQFSISKNILIAGYRPHGEIPYWLKAADVLVLPNIAGKEISRSWTSPMKMFEYMASKRPIVASDLPSIREILDSNSAVLVQPESARALSDGIEKALKENAYSAKLSENAYKTVQSFTWLKRARDIINFYELPIGKN